MKQKVLKIIRFTFIILFIIICNRVDIKQIETKTQNSNLNKTLDLHAMALKIDEITKNDLYTPLDIYNGDLTGYAADCPLCSGLLGCTGQNVLDRTTTYTDSMYGEVRIVASSTSLPCGSIVKFKLNQQDITAIVLDRGVTGTALDLLVESEDIAINTIGRRNISYDILRFGYTR